MVGTVVAATRWLTIKFLLCNAMTIVMTALEVIGQLHSLPGYLIDVSNLLVVVNSATNFIVYFRWQHVKRRLRRTKHTDTTMVPLCHTGSYRQTGSGRQLTNQDAHVSAHGQSSCGSMLNSPLLQKTRSLNAPPKFDAAQRVLLRQSWAQRKHEHLGRRIISASLALQPSLNRVIHGEAHLDSVGRVLDRFIEALVLTLTDDALAAHERQRQCSAMFATVVTNHMRLNIVFSTHVFSALRQTMLDSVLIDERSGGEEGLSISLLERCWLQVIAYMITSLKMNRYDIEAGKYL